MVIVVLFAVVLIYITALVVWFIAQTMEFFGAIPPEVWPAVLTFAWAINPVFGLPLLVLVGYFAFRLLANIYGEWHTHHITTDYLLFINPIMKPMVWLENWSKEVR